MADKFVYISNDHTQNTPSVDENKWLKRLNTQLNESTIKITKDPKFSNQTNNKTLL